MTTPAFPRGLRDKAYELRTCYIFVFHIALRIVHRAQQVLLDPDAPLMELGNFRRELVGKLAELTQCPSYLFHPREVGRALSLQPLDLGFDVS